MMVETILESSQDFGMSNGALPQWKRELLQRRAARARPPPAQPPPPPPPPPAAPDDEELRYGPGIVKRLKSRYLSLALRDAPRRRPSVLRRAASLEHLLDERPPPAPRPAPPRAPRPASLAAPPPAPAPRRDFVKRARSVDALSRLEARDEPQPPSPSPPPPPSLGAPPAAPPPPPPAPRTPAVRAARPPRRPTPLLRETERPPPDVVRSTLRKFESAPTRRPAPAARVSAVLRGLEGPRTSTPEPREPVAECRSPSPAVADVSAIDEPEGAAVSVEAKPVSRAALEGIARAGSSIRFAFEAPRQVSYLPPLATTNPVLVGRARRVGVIRPMPAPTLVRVISTPTPPPMAAEIDEKIPEVPPRKATPPPCESEMGAAGRVERRDPPPAALVEPFVRPPSRDPTPEPADTRPNAADTEPSKPVTNGHVDISKHRAGAPSRLGGAGIERAWNGSECKKTAAAGPWGSPPAARARGRPPPPAAVSVVFNFSDRKEVPDYIENDGLILRTRRSRPKAGESGVVLLRAGAGAGAGESDSESDGEGAGAGGPPSPCGVRFVNDNVLINGRSSMAARTDPQRVARLKLQFDDSLTRTFEYPSESSLADDEPAHCALADNTHIASAALCRYLPSKSCADEFQLGVARAPALTKSKGSGEGQAGDTGDAGSVGSAGPADPSCCGDARPCGADARSFSEARDHHTDLLF